MHNYIHITTYIHIFIYRYIYICIHVYIYTYIFVYIYLYIYVHLYIYAYLNVFICVHTYIHIFVCACSQSHTQTHTCTHECQLSLITIIIPHFFCIASFLGSNLARLTPQTFWQASLKQLQSTGGCEDKGLHFRVCSCLRLCVCVEENVCVCVRLCTCELVCGKKVRVCLRVSVWAYGCKVFELHGLPNLGSPT